MNPLPIGKLFLRSFAAFRPAMWANVFASLQATRSRLSRKNVALAVVALAFSSTHLAAQLVGDVLADFLPGAAIGAPALNIPAANGGGLWSFHDSATGAALQWNPTGLGGTYERADAPHTGPATIPIVRKDSTAGIRWHPHPTTNAVIRWSSSVEGTILIFGAVRSAVTGGDGLGLTVKRNGATLLGNSYIPALGTFTVALEASISPGDTIEFELNPGPANDTDYDTAYISMSISLAGPLVTGVSPASVQATNGKQMVTITGTNFQSGSTVTLRDLGTGEVFANRTKVSQSSTQIVLNPNFTAVASRWSVEVINPRGVSSGQFFFNVGQPGPAGAQVTNLTVAGPPGVGGGTTIDLSAMLHYSTGAPEDVSQAAAWSVAGGPPNTRMEGRTLRAGYTATPVTAYVRASYVRFDGTHVSAPVPIPIAPALGVRIQVAPPLATEAGTEWLAQPSAVVSGGTGNITPVWRWRGQEVPGYASPLGHILLAGPAGSGLLAVTVTDAAGKIGNAARSLVLNKPLAPNQPPIPLQVDNLSPGTLYGSDGVNGPNLLASRRDAGLVIITHGLMQPGWEPITDWMKPMAAAVEAALPGTATPNIVLYDWRASADTSKEKGVDEFNELAIQMLREIDISKEEAFRQLRIPYDPLDQSKLYELGAPGLEIATDILAIRSNAERHGNALADWLRQEYANGKVSFASPIHLIGHSAGGFLVTTCAGDLLHPDQFPNPIRMHVTTLDTPFMWSDRIDAVTERGGRLERYRTWLGYLNQLDRDWRVDWRLDYYPVLFAFGGIAAGVRVTPTIVADPNYRVAGGGIVPGRSKGKFAYHSEAHQWYIDTINAAESVRDGFWFSPILGNRWAPSPPTLAAVAPPPTVPDQPVSGFQTFGQVTQNAGAFTLTEQNDAGIFIALTVPVGAVSLKFRVRWDVVGDGDFLEVSAGDHLALAVVDGYARLVGQWREYEVPVNAFAGETETLVFRLASRGASNAVVSVDGIALVMSDDPDGDGLTLAEEAQAGTDSRYFDSDGDGFSDGYEVRVAQTDPTRYDSDGDGLDDYLERDAGTDPLSNASTLAARVARLSGGGFEVRWDSVRGKRYRVLRSATPGFEGNTVEGRGIVATGPATVFADPSISASSVPRMFYKVAVDPLLTSLEGDADFDGLTDAEEATHGSNPARYDTDGDGVGDGEEVNTLRSNPLLTDSDGDGASDRAELVAGTNPNSPTSVLAITSIVRNANRSVTLRWSGVAGRVYRVLRSPSPDFSSFQPIVTGWPGLPPITTFTDTGAAATGGTALFYKVGVE